MRTIESEVRALLKAIAAEGTFEPNTQCGNPICQILGRLESRVVGTKGKAGQNGRT